MSRLELQAVNRRMTSLLGTLAALEGIHPTAIEGVQLMRASQNDMKMIGHKAVCDDFYDALPSIH